MDDVIKSFTHDPGGVHILSPVTIRPCFVYEQNQPGFLLNFSLFLSSSHAIILTAQVAYRARNVNDWKKFCALQTNSLLYVCTVLLVCTAYSLPTLRVPGVPKCLSPRPNWDPSPPGKRKCPPPPPPRKPNWGGAFPVRTMGEKPSILSILWVSPTSNFFTVKQRSELEIWKLYMKKAYRIPILHISSVSAATMLNWTDTSKKRDCTIIKGSPLSSHGIETWNFVSRKKFWPLGRAIFTRPEVMFIDLRWTVQLA
jgi:hypothetical protein